MEKVNYKRIYIDGEYYYGKHLVLTAKSCNDDLLSVGKMKAFLATLVKEIDMVAYGEPIAARFGQGIEEGISAVQLIETSAITIHTNDMAREMYLDVFSCKGYKVSSVLKVLQQYFAPVSCNHQTLLRK